MHGPMNITVSKFIMTDLFLKNNPLAYPNSFQMTDSVFPGVYLLDPRIFFGAVSRNVA